MKTLIGLIPDDEHAVKAREALQVAGIGEGAISALVRPTEVWQRLGGPRKLRVAFRYAFFGALLGLVVGALYGIPAGLMNCSEIGCSFTTSTYLLVLISLYWALGGAFLGAIIGVDWLEHDLYSYVEGVRHGGALLVVETPDDHSSEVERILQRENGLLVHIIERT
jgi:hypothetical protein